LKVREIRDTLHAVELDIQKWKPGGKDANVVDAAAQQIKVKLNSFIRF